MKWFATHDLNSRVHIIEKLEALEILDSRGRPTVKTTCHLNGGATASASVPSGASTGAAEALELRDGDPNRYAGLGCRKAVEHVNVTLSRALSGQAFATQRELDESLLEWDGTSNKSRLGANTVLSVSVAFARAVSVAANQPLFAVFGALAGITEPALPRLTINLFSGGKHAGTQVEIQDVLLAPLASTIDEALNQANAVYRAAENLTAKKYGMRALKADEGGLAPPFGSVEAMLEDALEAVRQAGLVPGQDVKLAVDVASTHFFRDGRYRIGERLLTSPEMITRVAEWISRWPILSIEDGLAEDDWAHWPALRQTLEGRAWTLGDDHLCTNPARIKRAIATATADALLLKVNQIGTLTEATEALTLARSAGWHVVISARSGETEDDWLADLAVGWRGDAIKIGSVRQSERLAKYNRLLEIERDYSLGASNACPP